MFVTEHKTICYKAESVDIHIAEYVPVRINNEEA